MRHLFQSWDEVVEQVNEATQILLFLDYDGTLTPIVTRPEMAVLSSRTRRILKKISRHSLFKLAVISGRGLTEIKTLLGLENIAYAGNHGLEIECPPCYCQGRSPEETTFTHPIAKEFQPRLERLEQRLRKRLAGIDGVFIQNKGLSLSIHYRLARQTELRRIQRLSLEAVGYGQAGDKLQVTEGKEVLEVRPPVKWDKGKAIEWLMEMYRTPGSLPIFAGDDVTDEDGFEVLHKVGGISVLVGEDKASSAHYYLESPEQLHRWLEKLLGERQ
ncbi:MAG: trehalose-phosphatase [Dehalococcoidia bacterium]|nr:trehalose-phosphatase [Dehalococcoidia bacterium]MDH4291182.1 trehalose-phosphatase [Dehalococcoidia bacterium]